MHTCVRWDTHAKCTEQPAGSSKPQKPPERPPAAKWTSSNTCVPPMEWHTVAQRDRCHYPEPRGWSPHVVLSIKATQKAASLTARPRPQAKVRCHSGRLRWRGRGSFQGRGPRGASEQSRHMVYHPNPNKLLRGTRDIIGGVARVTRIGDCPGKSRHGVILCVSPFHPVWSVYMWVFTAPLYFLTYNSYR